MRQLDRFDEQILEILSTDGRLPVSDLAKRIGMSKSPCQSRLKRLQAEGYILGFRAVLDPRKLGKEHVAFTEVTLSDTREAALRAFNEAVQKVPEIEQCHMIAGSFDYLLKIRTADIQSYRRISGRDDYGAAACIQHIDLCDDGSGQGLCLVDFKPDSRHI